MVRTRHTAGAGQISAGALSLCALVLYGCDERPYPDVANSNTARDSGPPSSLAAAPTLPPETGTPPGPAPVADEPTPSNDSPPPPPHHHRPALYAAAPRRAVHAAKRSPEPPTPPPTYANIKALPPPKVYAASTPLTLVKADLAPGDGKPATRAPTFAAAAPKPAGDDRHGVAQPLLPALLLTAPLVFAILDLIATGSGSRRPSASGARAELDFTRSAKAV